MNNKFFTNTKLIKIEVQNNLDTIFNTPISHIQ